MIALLLAAVLAADSASLTRHMVVAPAETLTVVITAPPIPAAPTAATAATVAAALDGSAAGARIPIVLLPGLIGGAFGYRAVAPGLATAGHPTYTIELLGTGSSSHPPHGDYSLDTQADRVAAVLDSLGVGRAIIVGSNFAASVALRVAYRRPEHAAAVLLLDGGPVDRSSTSGVSTAMKLWPVIKLFGGRSAARRRIRDALIQSSADPAWITPEVVDAYTRPILADVGAAVAVMKAMHHARVSVPLRDNLERITQPVRLMIGAANRAHGIRPAETTLLDDRLPNLAIDSVARSGVYLHEERPDAVIAELLSLARSLADSSRIAAHALAAHSNHSPLEIP